MGRKRRYYIAISVAVVGIIFLIVGGIICASEMTKHYGYNISGNHKIFVEKFLKMVFIVVLGVIVLLLCIIHLIVERLKVEEKLHVYGEDTKKHVQIAHNQRLQEMGSLCAKIAHEVNNLMTPIMANSLMLLETISPDEDTEVYNSLLEMYGASEKAKSLISKISIMSRKEDHSPKSPINIDKFLKKACEYSKIMPSDNVHVVFKPGCGNREIMGQEISLLQVFMNLFTNACYAMEKNGGTITVSSSITDDGKWAEIRVTDTGGGISEKDMEHIFEDFYTTKPAGKGTGLGLPIVKEILKEHKGTITVRNVEKGAEFTVRLPLI